MILHICGMVLNGVVACFASALVCKNAQRLGLVQAPNQRSSHVMPTPTGGGLGFVVAASLAGFALALLKNWSLGWPVLAIAAILAGVGLQDDIRHVSAKVRLGTHAVVVAGFLVLIGALPDFVVHWPTELRVTGWWLAAALFLAGVWWINLFNFMDGIDGLAATQAVFMLLVAALMIGAANPGARNDPEWAFMLFVVVSVVGFLVLNWAPAKIFMGDVGSTWLGFVIFALALITVQKEWINYAAWLVLASVFLVDATVTLVTRLVRGERWYEAHRSHVYQRLSRRWQGDRKAGHRSVTTLVLAVNVLWVAPWAWACVLWPNWSLAIVSLVYAPLVLAALWLGAGRCESFSTWGAEWHSTMQQ